MSTRFEFLRRIRITEGLTIEQLAEKAGVSVDLISRLERGNREDISVVRLENILTALNLQLGDVFQHSNLDSTSDTFMKKFYSLSQSDKIKYAHIFTELLDLNNEK